MPGYDHWKTSAPDDDEPTYRQCPYSRDPEYPDDDKDYFD
jgi:hypothetical protein